MANIVVVGAQWGDEGKGKVVDLLTEKADVVARYQGGHNAGHTVIIGDEEFILHVIPSGILHRGKTCIIGNGVVIEPDSLIKELEGLKKRGVRINRNLRISGRAHVIMPYHTLLDGKHEESKGSRKIGTTGRGIGPAYVDKMSRNGIRMADLLEPDVFREKLRTNLSELNFVLTKRYGLKKLSLKKIYDRFMGYADYLGPFISDTVLLVNNLMAKGKDVLFEGAQGTLLDIDHGTYPYVTSSNASAGGVCTGLGVSPMRIDGIVGILKAYTTRVGEGPFPTELRDRLGEHLREKGGEFGATTGRPRRCGWLDFVSLRHSVRVNGYTGFALTKLDVLDGLKKIKVCVGYRYKDGKGKATRYRDFPQQSGTLWDVEPVYKELSGWDKSTKGLKNYRSLPREARAYIDFIEDNLNVPIDIVSTGQRRDEVIIRRDPFR